MSSLDWTRHRRRALVRRSRAVPISRVPPGVTGFRGVHFQRDKNKYRAVIEVDGARIHLGYYGFATQAARAYDAAAFKAWGSGAVLNFPLRDAA